MNRRQARRARALDRLSSTANAILSPHAEHRAAELGFSRDAVLQGVARPEQTYCSPRRYGPDRRVYQRGPVAIVLHEGSRTVITVLLRTPREWTHDIDSRRTLAY